MSDQPGHSASRRRRTRNREANPPPAAPPPQSASKADRDAERGLRGLVGPGPSQVGIVGAMRARDASRPTEEDLAAAERDVVIVRRHYVPVDVPVDPPAAD